VAIDMDVIDYQEVLLRFLGWDAPNSPVMLCGCLHGCHTTAEIMVYLLVGVCTGHE
jgi:hypothetical protein